MGVYGGSIGPRLPKVDGEVCHNCGGAFVMQPGIQTDEDGVKYLSWKCAQCNRTDRSPLPYSMQSGENVQTSKDFME